MRYRISDEDGIFSIVNVHRYKPFAVDNWTTEQLFDHFVDEMNNNSLIIWQANRNGGYWNIEVLNRASSQPDIRSFSKTIEVTHGELYMFNYNDLMVVNPEDYILPGKRDTDKRIEKKNGIYTITIRQMRDLDHQEDEDTTEVHYEFVMTKEENERFSKTDRVFWLDDEL